MLPLRVIVGRLCQARQPTIGRRILDHQERTGWGAKVMDRLASDLREAFPDMKGFSPRNLKYMRAFAAAWPERSIVQEALAQTPWYHHIALLEKLFCHLEKSLLELGQGFAFVGRQYRLDVGELRTSSGARIWQECELWMLCHADGLIRRKEETA